MNTEVKKKTFNTANKKIFFIIGVVAAFMALVYFGSRDAKAQFNRVGNQASVNASYINLNPDDSSSWEGVQITNTIPLGIEQKVFDQALRVNLDLNGGYTHNNKVDGTFGSFGVGTTFWINSNFDKAEWALAPYVRAGVAGNSGTLNYLNNQYWSYQVEPGLVGKYGPFYGLVAYNYSDGFKSDGLRQEAIGLGAGISLNKSFAIEARYDLGYGDYNVDKLGVGLTYKF